MAQLPNWIRTVIQSWSRSTDRGRVLSGPGGHPTDHQDGVRPSERPHFLPTDWLSFLSYAAKGVVDKRIVPIEVCSCSSGEHLVRQHRQYGTYLYSISFLPRLHETLLVPAALFCASTYRPHSLHWNRLSTVPIFARATLMPSTNDFHTRVVMRPHIDDHT